MSEMISAEFPGPPPPSNSEVTSGDQLAAGVAFNVLRAVMNSGLLVLNSDSTTTVVVPVGSVVTVR